MGNDPSIKAVQSTSLRLVESDATSASAPSAASWTIALRVSLRGAILAEACIRS
jgi:hypothetical protein